MQHLVVFLDAQTQFFLESSRVHEVNHAQADTCRLVAVGRADAALGRADFIFALEHFPLRVQFAVIRQDEVRRLAHDEVVADFHAELAQAGDFLDEADGVNDHAVADDAQFVFAQNAGRHEVQDVFLFADENGMAGVVATGVADDDVRILRQHVNDFAFAFVAPLSADQNCVCHIFSKETAPYVRNKNPRTWIRGKAHVFAQRG